MPQPKPSFPHWTPCKDVPDFYPSAPRRFSFRITADDHARPLAALLMKVAQGQDVETPTVILLQHQYTEANFSLRKLKETWGG